MPNFNLDRSLCSKDGICKKVCPVNIIRLDSEGWPYFAEGGEGRCISCGQCMAFCPHAACHIDGMPLAEGRRVNRKLLPSPEAVKELMQSRRSTRQFSKIPIPAEKVEEIMEAVRFAPTAKNTQSIRWVAVSSPEALKPLGDIMADLMASGEGEFAALAAAWRRGLDPFFRGAPNLIMAVVPKDWPWAFSDGAIALTYFELMAHAHGIGCCWGGYFTSVAHSSQAMRLALGLAENETVAGAQMFGYPSIKATSIPPRKPLRLSWI